MGRALLLVAIDIDPEHEDRLNAWYPEHMRSRLQWPGFRSARRFRAVGEGRPRYLAIYELDDPGAPVSAGYMSQPQDPEGAELARHWDLAVRTVYEEIDSTG